MNIIKLLGLPLICIVCFCSAQWSPEYRVENIAEGYLQIRFTLSYEIPIRPGVKLTRSSGVFLSGQTRTIVLPSDAMKISFQIEHSPFINTWLSLRSTYMEQLPANRPVRDCYRVWGTQQRPSSISISC